MKFNIAIIIYNIFEIWFNNMNVITIINYCMITLYSLFIHYLMLLKWIKMRSSWIRKIVRNLWSSLKTVFISLKIFLFCTCLIVARFFWIISLKIVLNHWIKFIRMSFFNWWRKFIIMIIYILIWERFHAKFRTSWTYFLLIYLITRWFYLFICALMFLWIQIFHFFIIFFQQFDDIMQIEQWLFCFTFVTRICLK